MNDAAKRILIVDDEPAILETVVRLLESEQYECVGVPGALEALQRLEASDFGVMLADIRMPGMDGLTLLNKARQQYPNMQVIMLTGVSDAETAIEAMRRGAFDYLIKPFRFEELVLTVRRALDHRAILIQNQEYQRELEKKVEERTELLKRQHRHLKRLHKELEKSFYDTIRVFIGLIELYEPFLGAHVKRVAALSITLAKFLNLPEEQTRTIEMAALLHDIGLLGISPQLMQRNRRELSPYEFELIKQGPVYGQKVLQAIPRLEYVGRVIRAQHEHFDGNGFPDGLKGEEIPYEARLLAVTNAYDAMRFKRDPSQSLSKEMAIMHLKKMRGRQFDPQLVDAFLSMLEQMATSVAGDTSPTARQEVPPFEKAAQSTQEISDPYRKFHYRTLMGTLENLATHRPMRPVAIADLQPGMEVAKPIVACNGTILVGVGAILTEGMIEKLQEIEEHGAVRGPAYVFKP